MSDECKLNQTEDKYNTCEFYMLGLVSDQHMRFLTHLIDQHKRDLTHLTDHHKRDLTHLIDQHTRDLTHPTD